MYTSIRATPLKLTSESLAPVIGGCTESGEGEGRRRGTNHLCCCKWGSYGVGDVRSTLAAHELPIGGSSDGVSFRLGAGGEEYVPPVDPAPGYSWEDKAGDSTEVHRGYRELSVGLSSKEGDICGPSQSSRAAGAEDRVPSSTADGSASSFEEWNLAKAHRSHEACAGLEATKAVGVDGRNSTWETGPGIRPRISCPPEKIDPGSQDLAQNTTKSLQSDFESARRLAEHTPTPVSRDSLGSVCPILRLVVGKDTGWEKTPELWSRCPTSRRCTRTVLTTNPNIATRVLHVSKAARYGLPDRGGT
ncbi:hypothetical protein DFH09DRAFT_1280813 [Mycena vulgaris]|nr:hypothetical protein DFH09DRAFT_1280813 [Mycena vulgaris]